MLQSFSQPFVCAYWDKSVKRGIQLDLTFAVPLWCLLGYAVVERFFGSLKHDWIFKVAQPTREHMKQDVADYIRYYNNDRLHTANNGMSPVKYEMSQINVSGLI